MQVLQGQHCYMGGVILSTGAFPAQTRCGEEGPRAESFRHTHEQQNPSEEGSAQSCAPGDPEMRTTDLSESRGREALVQGLAEDSSQ